MKAVIRQKRSLFFSFTFFFSAFLSFKVVKSASNWRITHCYIMFAKKVAITFSKIKSEALVTL